MAFILHLFCVTGCPVSRPFNNKEERHLTIQVCMWTMQSYYGLLSNHFSLNYSFQFFSIHLLPIQIASGGLYKQALVLRRSVPILVVYSHSIYKMPK